MQRFYRWKKQYAGLESTQLRELKQLSEENATEKAGRGSEPRQGRLQDVLSKKFPGQRS